MALYTRFLRKPKFGSYEDYLHNFKILVPENFNFAYDVLDVIAQEEPDKPALQWAHMDGRERAFTFSQIARQSAQAANLLTKLGIRRGDKVMLVLRRHYTFWIAIMALHRIGATAVPATHLLTKKDIIYRVQSADIKMIITSAEGGFKEQAEAALSECPTIERLLMVDGKREGWLDFEELYAQESDVFPRPEEPMRKDEMMLLYFTSGTSGMPKMVAHNFDYPLGHIQTAVFWHQCEDGGLHLTVSETGWAKSVWGKLYGQWLAGSAIMVYDFEKFVPRDLLKILEKYRVTTFCAPPTIYRFMIQEDLSQYDLSSIKHCTTAGEPLNPEVFNKWKEMTGHELREIFGQTELCVTIGTFPWMKICPGSMGKPSPQFDIDLVDEDGNSCPAGQVGEIVVRTQYEMPVGMFLGYYRDPERTASVWHDGVYHTLDLAWRDEWGYYWYVGRADDVIKSSGYRIGPFEVESALMEHPAVVETAITGVPDPVRGQIVKATVVLAKGYEPTEELKKELQNHVKKLTAPYKYPRIVEFVQELPKTISGKIRRVELRERDQK
ncbi:MAG TPA: AMP-binding protein [Candidatus Pullichristensenella excrementigallinarum]|uniref:AMP-binding protein n=1 Tax=Candidatus Pullichristensenella excrementigallinarum TaxID=2840907 RepID=A0A9D1IBE8_9FIRM|nr:AMP-binding protein [Candidatus Pullichristensenella excrementigallinarum]